MKLPKLNIKQNPALASLLIRCSLAVVFAYAAVDAFREPEAWVYFVPEFSNKFIDPKIALDILSVLQLVLAAWLITGRFIQYSAVIAVAMLGGIMIFNPSTFLITFRDIGLVGAAIALIFLDE